MPIVVVVVVNLCGASGNTFYWVVVGLMWGLGQDTLLGIVGLSGASGNPLYWVLLLVYVPRAVGLCGASGQHILLGIVGYVAPRATHFTGYCCWLMRGLRQHTLLGIIVGYARFWATNITGLTGHHRSDVGRLHQWVQNNPFFKQ
jgi:hypothetical protein